MFYSQFILAKKGPLGTIWIAAHLERKLKKNQVADTDIGVSVDSILFPEVPIALRLSSHLLLGVVRIYSRKVNYLFHDCSEALLKVKQAFRSTAVDLPPEESTAPYHSITLPETFDLDDFELPDSALLHGNFDDRHVSTREQITLQDTLDRTGYSMSQFGLDERFGDGDASQMGLDLDEELLLDNNLTLQDASVLDGAMHQGEGATDLTKMVIEEGRHGCHEDRNDEASKELSELLGSNRANVENVHRNGDSSQRLMFNIRTPDLNEVFLPDDHAGGPSVVHDIDMDFDTADPPSPEFNQSANFPSTPGLLEEAIGARSQELPASNPQNISSDTAPEIDKLDKPINQEVEEAIGAHSQELPASNTQNISPDNAPEIDKLDKTINQEVEEATGSHSQELPASNPQNISPDTAPVIDKLDKPINQEVECPDVTNCPINAASASPKSTNLVQVVSSPTSVLREPKPDSAVPINGDGQDHVESKDIQSTFSTLVLTEPVANSLVPQFSGETVAAALASALREADTLHTGITREEANGQPVSMDYSLVSGIASTIEVPHEDTTRLSNLDHGRVEDANSCQTSNFSALSSAFHSRPCTSESNQQNLISSWNMIQERAQGERPCNLETPMVGREMHFSGSSVNPQGFHSVISTEINLGVVQNSNNVLLGLHSGSSNPIELTTYCNPTIGVSHEDTTRLSNLDHGCVEDPNSCQTSNLSALSSAFHLRPCTSESNQANLISSWNMIQERAQGQQPCNLETPMVDREMHFSGSSVDPQGFHSVISTKTNLRVDQNSNNVLLGLQSGSSNPIELTTYCNQKYVQSGHRNCFSSSEFSEPERMRFAASGNVNLSNDLGQQTTEKGVIESDGSVDRISNLSGQKRRLADSTLNLQNDISPKTSGIPRKKRNSDYIPNDDDLLASILVGRGTPAVVIGPTPPLPKPPSLKRPRLTAKAGLPKKRKVLLDDTIVLHADAIRQQLINTEDIRRIRKKAPCTRPEIWRIQKSSLEDDIFSKPIFTGVSEALNRLLTQTYDLAQNIHSQVNAHHCSGESSKEVELSNCSVFRDTDGQEMAKQNAVIPKRVDDEMLVASAVSELIGVENHENALPVDGQEQLESPHDLHHVDLPQNAISRAAVSELIGVENNEDAVPVDGQEQLESPHDLHHVDLPHNAISRAAVSELIGVENHENAVPVDGQEQLESPLDLHLVDLPHNTVTRAELDILGHSGTVPVTHAASNSGIEEKQAGLCTDKYQNSLNKAFQTSQDISEVNNNLLHVAYGTSFEDFASADCAGGAGVVSNIVVAAIDNATSLEEKDFSNAKPTTITVEDMGVDVVNVDNLNRPQDGPANRGKDDCGGASVSTLDRFVVKIGPDFPADPSTVIGSVDASVPGMVLAGSGPVTSDYQAMNDSEAEKVTDEERPVSELPGGDMSHIDSFPVPPCTESERVPSAVGENSCLNIDGGLDVESNPMEFAATRESSDFCSAIDDVDTDFLNVDDDVDEYDEEANDDAQNTEDAQSLENSGWSSRTRGVARYLKNMFDQESGRGRKSVAIDHLLAGKTRKEASRMFFETLVLKTKDFIHVEQENPFDCISIKPRIKLLKSEF